MSKEKVLHDPIAYKMRGSSREFIAPTKEVATTGKFMTPGDNYGVGFRTPVGKVKASDITKGPIPQKSQCYTDSEVIQHVSP